MLIENSRREVLIGFDHSVINKELLNKNNGIKRLEP
jgi:hypothetical protein